MSSETESPELVSNEESQEWCKLSLYGFWRLRQNIGLRLEGGRVNWVNFEEALLNDHWYKLTGEHSARKFQSKRSSVCKSSFKTPPKFSFLAMNKRLIA